MMKSSSRASSRPNAVKKELDGLIRDIRASHRKAAKHGGQGCAELDRALVRAEAIRDTLKADDSQSIDWGKLTWTLAYLLEWVKLLCSSINCISPRGIRNDYWVYHKAFAPSPRSVTRGTRRETRRHADLPLYGRKRQEEGKPEFLARYGCFLPNPRCAIGWMGRNVRV